MYKVFFNDSFLIISQKVEPAYAHLHSFHLQSFNQIEKWIFEAEKNTSTNQLICLTNDPDAIWVQLKHQFRIIEAAGGLVKNKTSKYLFIHRRGKWDLPKGKIELGETPAIAAIREVIEETGLKHVSIINSITETYHLYRLKGKLVIKKTYWYLMQNLGTNKLLPQTSEDIEQAVWFQVSDIPELYTNIFASVKDVVSFLHNTNN